MRLSSAILLLAGVSIATYFARAGMILILADRPMPEPVMRALRNVGPAVLAALVVTLVANPEEANSGVELAEVAGMVAAITTAIKTRNLIPTLALGLIVFWVVRAVT
ncbi:MAG: AzlD domain-containing protein [Acidimicrobiales bacterium]|nr:AzlD domain-containing protein [Acidimicrobiales bacterium]